MDDTLPNPTTAVELRLHLAWAHGEDMRTTSGWYEMDSTHRHHHRVSADHEHENVAMV